MRELSSRKAARRREFLLINSLRHLLCKCHLPQEGGFRAVEGLAAARSTRGSDSPPDCHSLPLVSLCYARPYGHALRRDELCRGRCPHRPVSLPQNTPLQFLVGCDMLNLRHKLNNGFKDEVCIFFGKNASSFSHISLFKLVCDLCRSKGAMCFSVRSFGCALFYFGR